jgi:hypothetical protein
VGLHVDISTSVDIESSAADLILGWEEVDSIRWVENILSLRSGGYAFSDEHQVLGVNNEVSMPPANQAAFPHFENDRYRQPKVVREFLWCRVDLTRIFF